MPILQPGQRVEVLRPTYEAAVEQTQITVAADAGAYESSLVTFPAVAALTQADYFYFENQAGDDFAVWFDIDANGTPPSGAIYTAATTKIEVDVTTGQTAIQVAAAAVAAIGIQFTDVTVTDNLDGTVLFEQDLLGVTVDAAPHNADDSGAGSIGVSIQTQGAASTLQNKYFQIDEGGGADRFVWINVGAEGVEPAGTGTALEAAVVAGSSASAVATAIASAINADAGFAAESSGSVVYVRAAATSVAADVTDGDSGFSFYVSHQGVAARDDGPAGNLGASSNQPSLIS